MVSIKATSNRSRKDETNTRIPEAGSRLRIEEGSEGKIFDVSTRQGERGREFSEGIQLDSLVS
ncbi:hypothetical protein VTL71DRAFT_4807 [Oculimacula yallundae]|uniref:Uncharacterized protein n=1 Tax=Oculimacula yallundae TaxID=86028 RepID=A0ABR4C5E3_9HELO